MRHSLPSRKTASPTLAAIAIAKLVLEEDAGRGILRTRRIYDPVKEAHFSLTSSEGSMLTSLPAISEPKEESTVEDGECCYKQLYTLFPHAGRNAAQSLGHVSALEEGIQEEKCAVPQSFIQSCERKEENTACVMSCPRWGALLPREQAAAAKDVFAADVLLSVQKGYCVFVLAKRPGSYKLVCC